MNISVQKLRIHAMLMRVQEIQEEKSQNQIVIVSGGRNFGKVLAMGMDYGKAQITEKQLKKEVKKIDLSDFEAPNLYLSEEKPSKYFGKPKNNFKK